VPVCAYSFLLFIIKDTLSFSFSFLPLLSLSVLIPPSFSRFIQLLRVFFLLIAYFINRLLLVRFLLLSKVSRLTIVTINF
jgi:hypothetical protein